MNRLKMVSRGSYEKEDVEFLEPWLEDSPENIRLLILKILCEAGNPVSKYIEMLTSFNEGHELSSKMVSELINLAEKQGDSLSIASIVKVERKNVHQAVLALKRMGETGLMAAFSLSNDPELSHLVMEISK